MIKDFSYQEKDLKIYQNEFASRLPDTIIDNHIHIWSRECLNISREEYSTYKVYKPWTDFDYMEEFTVDDYYKCTELAFPNKKVYGMFFGSPFPQIDRDRVNEYVLYEALKRDMGFYYIPGQYENMFETEKEKHLMNRKGFLGFKPYPDIPIVNNRECSIYDMLNKSFLEFAQMNKLSVVLHIPRKGRLSSQDNRRELLEISENYPDVCFIIAHVGRSFSYCDVENNLDFLIDRKNMYFDTALINSETVLEYLMRRVDSSRILFGADAPLAFSRGKDVTINNKHYYVSENTTPWGLGPINPNLADFTFYVYEEVRAILYASRAVYGGMEKEHLERIFYLNAKKILDKGGVTYA